MHIRKKILKSYDIVHIDIENLNHWRVSLSKNKKCTDTVVYQFKTRLELSLSLKYINQKQNHDLRAYTSSPMFKL